MPLIETRNIWRKELFERVIDGKFFFNVWTFDVLHVVQKDVDSCKDLYFNSGNNILFKDKDKNIEKRNIYFIFLK